MTKIADNKSMKKCCLIFILFFCCFLCFPQNLNYAFSVNDYNYTFLINDKNYNFKDNDFKLKLTKVQSENYHNLNSIQKLKKNNFTNEEIISYLFPEISQIFQKLSLVYNKDETEDEIFVLQNKCKLDFVAGENGKCINREKFFEDAINQLTSGEKNLKIKLDVISYKDKENIEKFFNEKSCFSTNFSTSSFERKNNIKTALKSLDGLVVDEGEVFSFNNSTGERNEESGYSKAKIISNGTFVMGFGGGVCQVSTTLYNACLLAGLEIVEVSSHSLPVSYVEPSFDAMVSFGSSDLKVRNNSGGKIIITTSSENDVCKIKIFGLKNKYKITRQSEKLTIIPAEKDVVESDYKKYGDIEMEIGEEKRLSFAKDGFVSRGYLNFYDNQGKLVERKLIRENKYNATRGVVLKREN